MKKFFFIIFISVMTINIFGEDKYINAVWYNVYQIKIYNENNAKATIDEHFKKFKTLNINRVFFLVKHPNGRAYYNSKILKPIIVYNDEEKKYQTIEWDILDYVIRKGKDYNIEVFPYVNIFAEEGYFLEENPELAEVKKDGKILGWSSPVKQKVIDRNIEILKEIIKNYDVKGIQFDRIRYEDIFSGYNKESIEKFVKIYGREPESEKDKDFIEYRKNNITEFVEKAYKELKKVKPDIEISAAVFHSPTTASDVLQDWAKWVEKGILDTVYTMSYTNNISIFKKYLEENINVYNKNNGKVKLIIGIGAYYKNMTVDVLLKQLKMCFEKKECSGVCWFNAYSIFDEKFYDALKNIDYINKK